MPADDRRLPVRLPWTPTPPPAPTPLHTLTLAEVMSPPDAPLSMSADWDDRVKDGWRDLERLAARPSIRDGARPCGVEGYAIASDPVWRSIAVIVAGTGEPAGGLIDGNLHVLAAHQGKGLATAITELAFAVGFKRIGHKVALSAGGRATRRAAHRLSVRHAIAAGIPVRSEVLADYPELRASALATGSLRSEAEDPAPGGEAEPAEPAGPAP